MVTDPTYDWKRYWYPKGSGLSLADDGFLPNPENAFASAYNPHVVPVESIADTPCLALLGEPGIGKTRTIETQHSVLGQHIIEQGGRVFSLDLKPYGDENRLERKIRDSNLIQDWLKDKYPLLISLDSLDECLLRINTVTALLIEIFEELPIERLWLRIACRTAEWPESFEESLKHLWQSKWGKESVKAYELAPLRRIDVQEAANANNLVEQAFVHEIQRLGVVPFAIKPVTLNFLLRLYSRNSSFPATQTELYRQGCRLLCEEPQLERRETGPKPNLSSDKKLAVASRIAAVTVFANRFAVWKDIYQGEDLEDCVSISELTGGVENATDGDVEVNNVAVNEALATGLFTSRGSKRMGWSHQTYAEFLAAHYLVEGKISLPNALSLICHPNDPGNKLVPQLHETSAWLASMRPDIFREIMNIDPQVLLRSDIATATSYDIETLVSNLLRLFEEERLLDDRGLRTQYGKLLYAGLAQQIRPYIIDSTKGFLVRRVAVDIAESCNLRELQNELAKIALDDSESYLVRVNTAHAVVRIGDATTKAQLRPLAEGRAGDDPDDELKGCGLRAVWPEHIAVNDLFSLLTLPNNPKLYGVYKGFLLVDLVKGLKPRDLTFALNWLKDSPLNLVTDHFFSKVVTDIISMVWDNLAYPGLLPAFAETLSLLLQPQQNSIFDYRKWHNDDLPSRNDHNRRMVLKALIPLLPDSIRYWRMGSHGASLVYTQDFLWIIEQLQQELDETVQQKWLGLIQLAINWNDPLHFDVLANAVQTNDVVAERYGNVFHAVRLDSIEAKRMKDEYLEEKQFSIQNDKPALYPPPHERIMNALRIIEEGEQNAWIRLCLELTLNPDSSRYEPEFDKDLTALPGWQTADDPTKKRLIEAGYYYLSVEECKTEEWISKTSWTWSDFAQYAAFRLLIQEAPDLLSSLPVETWRRWAPMILAFPNFGYSNDARFDKQLVSIAYANAPKEIISTLIALIDEENKNKEQNTIFVLEKVEDNWDEHIASALLLKIKDHNLKPTFVGKMLADLLAHGVAEAEDYAKSQLLLPISSDEPARGRARFAAYSLIYYAEDAGWDYVWPAINDDISFGCDVITLS